MQNAQKPSKVVLGGAAAGRREREVTMPGRDTDPYPPPERRIARLLVAITGGSAVAFACVAFVGFQILLYAVGDRGKHTEPECTEGVVPDGCAEGLTCVGRTCMPEQNYPTRCDLDDPCGAKGTCTCDGAMQCVADVCVRKEGPSTGIDICEEPEVKAALKQLKTDCAGNITHCPAPDLQRFAIKYKDFDTLVARFPDTITVHFPGGMPPIDKGAAAWPTGQVEQFYLERLRRSSAAFQSARSIFVIARSSPGGSIVRNELFAQARSNLVKDLVLRSLAELAPADRDAVENKFFDFILSHKRRIGRDFFSERYANRFITWDMKSRDRLIAHLGAEDLGESDEAWLTQTINQVVLIVPVPCEIK